MSNTTFTNKIKPASGKTVEVDGADILARNVRVTDTPLTDDALITKQYFENNRAVSQINTLLSTSSYEIQNSDLTNYSKYIIYADPSTGNQLYTLPPLDENQGKVIRVQTRTLGGKVTIQGQSGARIGGYSSLALQSENNYLEVVAGREWEIIDYYCFYDVGWQNRSDWSTVHYGTSTFDYDNRSDSGEDHFIEGELITEASSGNTGIIQADTKGTSSGTLTVKNVTGTGIWTNNATITGQTSGTTALVNEGSGSNKNQDTDLFHEFGVSAEYIHYTMWVNDTATMINAKQLARGDHDGYFEHNHTPYMIDANTMRLQSAEDFGVVYLNEIGQSAEWSTADKYWRVTMEVRL